MDDLLTRLNEAVAAAADAHLTDPLDTAVYERLVSAVLARRAHLAAQRPLATAGGARLRALPGGEQTSPASPDESDEPHDNETADTATALPTALDLSGDPRAVLARLRGGALTPGQQTPPD